MRVRLGAPVMTKEMVQVGTVGKIVIDRKSLQIIQLVVRHGRIFASELIIQRSMANHVSEDGKVFLNLTEQEFEAQKPYFTADYVPPGHQTDFSWNRAIGAPIGGPLTTITDDSVRYSNLPENVVVIEKGMDVNDVDGEKIGELEDLEFDQDVAVTGFTVSSGRRHKQHQSFKVDQVAGVGVDYVRVNVAASEVQGLWQSS
jgi:sporulation protein YlmC with PRC-barrel domain